MINLNYTNLTVTEKSILKALTSFPTHYGAIPFEERPDRDDRPAMDDIRSAFDVLIDLGFVGVVRVGSGQLKSYFLTATGESAKIKLC